MDLIFRVALDGGADVLLQRAVFRSISRSSASMASELSLGTSNIAPSLRPIKEHDVMP